MTQWPGERALSLLEEFEADPRDYSYIDLDRLLDAWGITECLPGQEVAGYRARMHPALPSFPIGYRCDMDVHPEVVRAICRAVRRIHDELRDKA